MRCVFSKSEYDYTHLKSTMPVWLQYHFFTGTMATIGFHFLNYVQVCLNIWVLRLNMWIYNTFDEYIKIYIIWELLF